MLSYPSLLRKAHLSLSLDDDDDYYLIMTVAVRRNLIDAGRPTALSISGAYPTHHHRRHRHHCSTNSVCINYSSGCKACIFLYQIGWLVGWFPGDDNIVMKRNRDVVGPCPRVSYGIVRVCSRRPMVAGCSLCRLHSLLSL